MYFGMQFRGVFRIFLVKTNKKPPFLRLLSFLFSLFLLPLWGQLCLFLYPHPKYAPDAIIYLTNKFCELFQAHCRKPNKANDCSQFQSKFFTFTQIRFFLSSIFSWFCPANGLNSVFWKIKEKGHFYFIKRSKITIMYFCIVIRFR